MMSVTPPGVNATITAHRLVGIRVRRAGSDQQDEKHDLHAANIP